jgi:hypothetical protein
LAIRRRDLTLLTADAVTVWIESMRVRREHLDWSDDVVRAIA